VGVEGKVNESLDATIARKYEQAGRRKRDGKNTNLDRRLDALRSSTSYGTHACEVCDLADRFGELGGGFAECHHVQPLTAGVRETRLDDLAVVCANCHRMIHRSAVPLDLEALQRTLR